MRRVLQAALLMSGSMAALAAGAPQIPTELTAPAGAKLVLKAHATGSQIYTCKAGNGRRVPVGVERAGCGPARQEGRRDRSPFRRTDLEAQGRQ